MSKAQQKLVLFFKRTCLAIFSTDKSIYWQHISEFNNYYRFHPFVTPRCEMKVVNDFFQRLLLLNNFSTYMFTLKLELLCFEFYAVCESPTHYNINETVASPILVLRLLCGQLNVGDVNS